MFSQPRHTFFSRIVNFETLVTLTWIVIYSHISWTQNILQLDGLSVRLSHGESGFDLVNV